MPDPRVIEDIIVRGEISLRRSASDDETRQAIEVAVLWLLARARELRESAR
jgi:hypothetical protein